jgi:chromosome segregation ATPase
MEQRAQVTSVEAIEAFRSCLILFLGKARPTLEEVMNEVMRTRSWLQNDQRVHWEKQVKTRRRDLEQAQAELFSARISNLEEASALQQMAVQRAHRAVEQCEDKLRVLKKWDRELENRSEPLLKLVEQLHGYLSTDMVKATAYLTEMIKTLQAYAEVQIRQPNPASVPVAAEPADPNSPSTS